MPFTFEKQTIPEVILVVPRVFDDERGFFLESYKQSVFSESGIPDTFLQDNHSKSNKGVLRGLHYQKSPKGQGKLVRVICGSIYDVAVDIRKDSPTYGKWVGVELSAGNKKMLWIPEGFAHGFLTLEDNTEVLYKTTNEYSPEHERSIIWNDAEIGINWPDIEIILNDKDKNAKSLSEVDIE